MNELGKLITACIGIDYRHKHNHLPGALSALPIIKEIYDGFGPRDVFLLSKGHACSALYAMLQSRGLSPDESKSHPDRDPTNGITNTGGSLGHGLPMAVGLALAKQLAGEPGTVHVLLGDGEAHEGTTWESLLLADAWKLDNLHVHIDGNGGGCLWPLQFDTHALFHLCTDGPLQVKLTWHHTKKGQGLPSLEGTHDHVCVHSFEDVAEMLAEVERAHP